jgi:hypothetical protein
MILCVCHSLKRSPHGFCAEHCVGITRSTTAKCVQKIVAACGSSSNAAAWLPRTEVCELVFLRPFSILRPPGRRCADVLFDDCEDNCPADSHGNGDGVVAVDDLLIVIGNYGGVGPAGDVDEDGIVGVNDLLMVIDSWGLCE